MTCPITSHTIIINQPNGMLKGMEHVPNIFMSFDKNLF